MVRLTGSDAFSLGLAGDVMLGRLVDEALEREGTKYPWEGVGEALALADVLVYNLECAICNVATPEWRPHAKTFHFRLDPSHAETLTVSSVDGVLLANNHTLDHGVDGLLETVATLDDLRIPHAGAGRNLSEAMAPARVDPRVALVGAADHLVEWAAGDETPGIHLFDPMSGTRAPTLARAIATAQGMAPTVLVGLHWGPNMRRVPPARFRECARDLIAAGASVVWGTSAHLFQGIEFYQNGVILYDAGDFVDDYAVDAVERNDRSFLFLVHVEDDGACREVELVPTTIVRCAAHRSRPADADASIAKMRALCAPFGTRVTQADGRWVVSSA